MPNPYSQDLRERIVAMMEAGSSAKQAALHFKVNQKTASAYYRQYKQAGHLKPMAHSGGAIHKKLFEPHIQALTLYLQQQPDATNDELRDRLVEQFGPQLHVHPSQIGRAISRAGLTRKKKSSTTPRSTTR